MRRFVNDVEMGPRVSSFSPHAAAIKHHGLYNQGATCYLNSVLQVLFMTKDFREAVERNPCEKGDDYIDHQLKTLFHVLKDNTAETRNITRKLGIHRVYEQRDAAEHFDQILSLTSPEASKIFSGLLTHQSECSGCHILTETDGQFWHLPLALVDPCSKCYSVVDGIKEFFKVSFITGENQLFCDHCDAKADATVKCVVKHHPEVLMLLLKRFEFNYRYMTYVKNSCVVDVPYTLQIPENQTYELYAVVDHYGDLRGGHYTATVKSQDDERWYNFNDTRVTLLDYQTFQVDHTESSTRSQSVYLLFYRKNQTDAQDMRGESTSGHFSPAASNHDDQKIRERERSGEKRKKKNKNKKKPEDDEGFTSVYTIDPTCKSATGTTWKGEVERHVHEMKRFKMNERDQQFRTSEAAIKHHGLYNQGATCYLNSVLQVLFMTKDFREAVERNPCEKGDDYIDHQLKTLFHVLKDNTAETHNITRKLGIHRVYEQRDAAEHFDQILSLTSPEASKIFSGLLTHQSECSGCHILTETDGPFWHLPLALVDPCSKCYSVVDGIEEFFKVSFITGENQLFCDHCDAKADATVKCVVKHHPEVLMLLLKRFEFNYRYMTYVKNSCVVDVPYTLQIPENQTYELYAVVDHYGDLRGGHYTATVKSQDDERWYNFNDTRVTLLDYQTFQVDHTESSTRSQSVYLLFYRKNQTDAQDMRGESTSGHFSPAASNHDDQKIRERERSGEKRKKKNKNKKKPEDDEGCKHGGSNRLYKEHEQQREERRDDKGQKEQERGDDEPAQRKETFTTKPYLSESVEDQDKRRFEGVRQNKPEQEISVTHTTYKNVGVEKQAKEQENKEDKPIQRRAEIAERGRLTENQGAQSAKRTRLEDSQKKKENSQTKHLNRAAECHDNNKKKESQSAYLPFNRRMKMHDADTLTLDITEKHSYKKSYSSKRKSALRLLDPNLHGRFLFIFFIFVFFLCTVMYSYFMHSSK
ncbi:uncharacterized protein [Trachinotus anak]|uniref:uncharacterized protein isoform X7 n=1 Tax=Trachinotus anak TaxID=443729 RepID=UPI0039F1BA33